MEELLERYQIFSLLLLGYQIILQIRDGVKNFDKIKYSKYYLHTKY